MEAIEFGLSNGTATGSRDAELHALQKDHDEKSLKIQELKKQIELTKCRLEKKKKEISEEKMGGFNSLSKKYNSLREEYNAMLAGKLRKSK
ncbi:hypothetical protein LR48_Vigan08g194700 [Vigna angularis]|nr:hypothetical protein LR48_Vigan08g194700 [Vigna angularis]BAT91161.1 hypothetical protein VIGAN_06247300 [Vigna angularis var. angularis]